MMKLIQAHLSRFCRYILSPGLLLGLLLLGGGALQAQDSCGAYITEPATDLVVSEGGTVVFSGTTDFGVRLHWDYGDGSPIGIGTPVSHTYPVAGNYTVTFSTWAAGYTTSYATRNIRVLKPIAVSIAPVSVSLVTNQATTFSATVTGGSGNTAVTWNSTGGSCSGPIYTAPGFAGTFTVTATSVEDLSKSASATVMVSLPVSISVSPTPINLLYGQSQAFSASVSGGNGNTSVNWSCNGGSVTPGGVYTAPNIAGTYKVTATSAFDSSKTDSATVYVAAPVLVSVSPTTVNLLFGQAATFSATVSGGFGGTAVTWTASGGSISSGGVYVAPSTAGTYMVTATSVADPSQSASATITVQPPVGISITPASASLLLGQQQTFSATVTGGFGGSAVTWSTNGGSVTTGGMYTAPSTVGTYVITATSVADPTKAASASITVVSPISVVVSPDSVSLIYTQQQSFTSSVTGGFGNTAVTWSATGGSVTAGGIYTAPSTSGIYLVTATSVEDASRSVSATVTVQPPVTITITPTTTSLIVGQQQAFIASVAGGIGNTTVTWAASGGSVTSTGLYTAPGTPGTFMVTATSVADSSKTATATITVVPAVAVSISPSSVSLVYGQQQTFLPTVTGGFGNTAVTWTASGGSVTSGGVYTAPSTSGTYSISAVSVADSTKQATATVTVTAPVGITVSPAAVTLIYGQQQVFSATVAGGTGMTSVTWSTTGGSITSTGVYTAPAIAGSYTVLAVSVADATKSATATVTVVSSVAVSVSPSSASLTFGQQAVFTATVTGGLGNTAVTWSASSGTITSAGLYTAPTTAGSYTVTATSVADSTKSASASLSVAAAVAVSINPASASLVFGQQQTFTGTVTGGTGSTAVTWTATGGSITVGGVYTAPSTAGTYAVKATSVADSTKSASASVTVVAPVTVHISPTTIALAPAQQTTFTAAVSGGLTGNTSVTWTCSGGTVTSTGVYAAPVVGGNYTVTATSAADPTKSATANVTVSTTVTSVSVSPTTISLDTGQQTAFSATLTGMGGFNTAVVWTATGGTVTSAGSYTAPATVGTYQVRATSVQDPTKYGEASVTVNLLVWEADILYLGTREVGEVDVNGFHITHVDHLGSPRMITGPTGAIESKQKFMPFGESLTDPASASKFSKGFTNHEQTDASGLIYMQARFYAPWYGRFLSPDPARDQHFEETQSWNIYSYVQNNPTMKIDPTGMVGEEIPLIINALTWYFSKSPSNGTRPGSDPGAAANLKRAEALVDAKKPVGDAECVALVKEATGNKGNPTSGWYGTEPVLGSGAQAGTPVMTPDANGFYPQGAVQKHGAVLAEPATSKEEIVVIQQWAPRAGPPPREGKNPHRATIKDKHGKGKRQQDASQYVIIQDFKKKKEAKDKQ